MTSVGVQVCGVPADKMVLFIADLHQLKSNMEATAGRLKAMVDKVADLQRDHEEIKEAVANEPYTPHAAATTEDLSGETCPAMPEFALPVAAGEQEAHAGIAVPLEAQAGTSPVGHTDAAAPDVDATTLVELHLADDSETTIVDAPIVEEALSAEPFFPEIAFLTVAAQKMHVADAAGMAKTLQPRSGAIDEVFDPVEGQVTAARNVRPIRFHGLRRWAAGMAFIALVGAAAVGTGFGGFGEIARTKVDSIVETLAREATKVIISVAVHASRGTCERSDDCYFMPGIAL
jgi:hypothetical protein